MKRTVPHRSIHLCAAPLVLLAAVLPGCSGLRGKADPYRPVLFVPPGEGEPVIDFAHNPERSLVQLHARRFRHAEALAIHPWFLCWDASLQRWERWHVHGFGGAMWSEHRHLARAWSSQSAEPREVSACVRWWGNLGVHMGIVKDPPLGVVLEEWWGEEAEALIDVLRSNDSYPHSASYHLWPGPNSNTYIAWAVREAGVHADLHPLGVGKDYLGWLGFGAGFTTTGTGAQIETPLVGLKLGLLDGIELHLLATTLGLDAWPPAFKTPLGRFGFAE